MSTARALAFELSQLPALLREQLLQELPAERRAQLEQLLMEIAGLLREPAVSFERQLDMAATQAGPAPLAGLNDGQLRLLLSAEHPSVQKHLVNIVRGGRLSELAPAVEKLLTEYLSHQVEATEVGRRRSKPAATWWRRWRGLER